MIRDEHLEPLLRAASWMPRDLRAAHRYETVDHVELGPGELLLVVAAVGGPASGGRIAVPAHRDASGALTGAGDDGPSGLAAVRRVLTGARLRTTRGGHVEFRRAPSAPAGEVRWLPFDKGWSSNALSLVEIDGTPHLHKTYRLLDQTVHEPEVLRLMSGTGHTPEWAGDYTYTDPVRGTRHPLGVLYRHAPGHGIDAPLRENLRSLWPLLSGGTAPEQLVCSHLRPLEGRLRAAGRFLSGFHRDLSARLGGPATGYPVADALGRASARLAELAGADTPHPRPARDAAFAALEAEIADLEREFAGRPTAATGGPCHGDLHLSHLLCAEGDDGTWRMSVIDLSTPALPCDGPGYAAQSPLQDLVAVQRALEYFAADEAAFESARRLGVDSTRTMNGSLDGAPGLPPAARSVLGHVFRTADTWRERVLHLLLGPASDNPLRRLLYLRRLLHELGYNHDHARPYHAAIDLRHALALAAPAPTTPART
ncbi:hypothetical protein GCM10010503_45440 [Streptomyces lucensis JCM 4490]|uniref:Uncharacterized protein n=1 Tax=Streptomyces lucensis JCM 4490 TaxID=1306176 RepID=A0A918J967_9ACTN|nr:hypothetical protein [Streptomyces lucensis]GGW63293.1 hypothetical protein GCM10010503_45440 [Streptomyces lucensis JCM 4490]